MTMNDFLIEQQLHKLDPELHQRFRDGICALQKQLVNYQYIFPEFTDHSELHALTVIDYCNELVSEEIQRLNAHELYVLLMACYYHDIGMGIRTKEYTEFFRKIDFGDYFETHDRMDVPRTIRDFHNEFSGLFFEKYAALYESPSDAHTFAIVQTIRGHRKTDLFDETEYPQRLDLPSGDSICLPYLAAILRLADEMDVTSARNPEILYDISQIKDDRQIFEHKKHKAVQELEVTREDMILHVDTQEPDVYDGVVQLADKLQRTLDYCVRVVRERTPYEITQRQVHIKRLEGPDNMF